MSLIIWHGGGLAVVLGKGACSCNGAADVTMSVAGAQAIMNGLRDSVAEFTGDCIGDSTAAAYVADGSEHRW